MLAGHTIRKVERIFDKVRIGDTRAAIVDLETSTLENYFPGRLIEGFCRGLRNQAWEHLRELFLERDFISKEGLLLWMAPYKQLRNGKRDRVVTGIFGVTPIEDSYSEIRNLAESLFKNAFHAVPVVIGVRRIASFGMAGGRAGEAFLVPTHWDIGDTADGPALNDMTEQYARIRAAEPSVRIMLTDESADLVLSPVLDTNLGASIQNLEFQYHEVAHGIGAGFADKVRLGLFRTFHNCAVEEWRSDGVSFSLMSELLSDETRGRLVAANLALRLSVDALREGGLDADRDAHATALTLQDLLDSGAAEIRKNRLRLAATSYAELAIAVDRQRTRAWQTTLKEIGCVGDAKALDELYSGVALREETAETLRSLLVR
jgi:hypothetical protein